MNEKPNAVQNSSKYSHMFIDEKVMTVMKKYRERILHYMKIKGNINPIRVCEILWFNVIVFK